MFIAVGPLSNGILSCAGFQQECGMKRKEFNSDRVVSFEHGDRVDRIRGHVIAMKQSPREPLWPSSSSE
jgi:hypothetical protein